MDIAQSLLAGGVALAVPLLLAALGEIIMERAGIIDIALEGKMLVAAFFAMLVTYATGSPAMGVVAGILAAGVMALLFAGFCVSARADQIIVGAGLNILALGVTGVLFRQFFGLTGDALTTRAFAPLPIPALAALPVVGPALFQQNVLVYLAGLAVPATWFLLQRTRFGLHVRACGENPAAADSAGIQVSRVRFLAVCLGGSFCGVAGAYLALAQANTFIEGMTAGRGFIALAIVIFARWNPFGAVLVSLLFGIASALQFQFQALGLAVPHQFFLMLPYILTIVVAAGLGANMQAPAALAKSYQREE